MTQSMSRVAHCTDNGPMEGFWGIMKREMYYGKKYKTKDDLLRAIEEYIDYYTNRHVQRKLDLLTPMEYHERLKSAASKLPGRNTRQKKFKYFHCLLDG